MWRDFHYLPIDQRAERFKPRKEATYSIWMSSLYHSAGIAAIAW
jgi:hypothetical protein